MKLLNWHPFQEINTLTDQLDRSVRRQEWNLPRMELDVAESPDHLLIKAAVPGATKESFEVSYEGNYLTLAAEVAEEQLQEGFQFHLRERSWGKASRSLRIPFPLQVESAEASFENGVLTLKLPKAANARRQVIPIQ